MTCIDVDRLTLPLILLDKAHEMLPACISDIEDTGDYHDIKHAISLLSMALVELHRLQEHGNAPVTHGNAMKRDETHGNAPVTHGNSIKRDETHAKEQL
jgi:hypothetical protein